MPDAELLAHAAAGDLHRPEVLVAQARRMLRDDRVRGLATEFAGNWLDFRRFEEHNSVDRERFPSFTNELRQAMFEEPIRFFIDVVQRGPLGARPPRRQPHVRQPGPRPALRHARSPASGPTSGSGSTTRARYGRGGLLPMAVFLTKNSPGLRTSPVKRGYWVVRRLLGEQIPPPPPDVPELPKDEAKLGELTLPQLLARHRADKSCAGCHQRFDSIGLAFEGYGPVGERRDARPRRPPGRHPRDLPRRQRGDGPRRPAPLPARAPAGRVRRQPLPQAARLRPRAQPAALGRRDPRGDATRLAADGYRFGSLVEAIVTSPQFLNKRGRRTTAAEESTMTMNRDHDIGNRSRSMTRRSRRSPAHVPPRRRA